MAASPSIAVVTTCKGRLHHLSQTLPLVAAQQPDELIVVDYACPAGTAAWVEANVPQAKVVRAGRPGEAFNTSHARNSGAAAASADWLLFVDADVRLAPGMLEHLRGLLEPGHFYGPKPSKVVDSNQLWGSFACPAREFAELGGYDEVIEGWGHEDEDLYRRLLKKGLQRGFFPFELLEAIPHEDTERVAAGWTADRWENEAANACYAMAKREISFLRGGNGDLPLEDRRKLMLAARKVVAPWYAKGAREPLAPRFVAAQSRPVKLASQVEMRAHTVVTITLLPPSERIGGDRPAPAGVPGAQAGPAPGTPDA